MKEVPSLGKEIFHLRADASETTAMGACEVPADSSVRLCRGASEGGEGLVKVPPSPRFMPVACPMGYISFSFK